MLDGHYIVDSRPIEEAAASPHAEMLLVQGASGVGKSTLLRELDSIYDSCGLTSRPEMVSFSHMLLEILPVSGKDELRSYLKTPEDNLPHQKKVFDKIYAKKSSRTVVDMHAALWYPESGRWGDGFPEEFSGRYDVAGMAFIEPESEKSLKKQIKEDRSRDRSDFPSVEESLYQEKKRFEKTAKLLDCPTKKITNRYGHLKESAKELYDFVERTTSP